MNIKRLLYFLLTMAVLIGLPVGAFAADAAEDEDKSGELVPVMFHGRELFKVGDISALTAKERANVLVKRFERKAKSPLFNTAELTIFHDKSMEASVIFSGPEYICVVWESDAKKAGRTRKELAEEYKESIRDAIDQYRKDYTITSYLRGIGFAAIATVIFLLFWFVVIKLCKKEILIVNTRFADQKMFKFIDGKSLITINDYSIRLIRLFIILWGIAIYLNFVLSFFPWTFNLSARLFHLITSPVIMFYNGFVEKLPDLFVLVVIATICYGVLRATKNVFNQIAEGNVHIKGFYSEWSEPTYRLIRLIVIVFALVAAFPYIPGSSSPAFKGISIFMGVLFSMGSSSAVGNIFAGVVLTYMRPFTQGDFVKISGIKGTVMSRRTFSTRLRTPRNQIVTIPNTSVSSNHIINYSRMAKQGGIILETTVTIGYDVPWRKVHELLTAAAEGAPDVLDDPPPSIIQSSLDDFYVAYKLRVTTQSPQRGPGILSTLHQRIQDNFAKADIEILSPHYRQNRSGEETTIPELYPVKKRDEGQVD
jgi:small-conductance mechanosensitive channel